MVEMCKFYAQGWEWCSSTTFSPPRMVTFRPRCGTHWKSANLAILAKIAYFQQKCTFSPKIAKISKNGENGENGPQIPIKTYGIIAIFAPGRKSMILCEIAVFYVKKQKICKNNMIYVKTREFQKIQKNRWISALMQGPIFGGKLWNSSIFTKLCHFH